MTDWIETMLLLHQERSKCKMQGCFCPEKMIVKLIVKIEEEKTEMIMNS